MAPSVTSINPARLRHFILRIPVCTRLIIGAILCLWVCGIWKSVRAWAVLEPNAILVGGAHRLTTYAFMHIGVLQLVLSLVAVVPLLDRFENEYGTLTSLALFTGPFTTFPALLYTLTSLFVFRTNYSIAGSSTWSFLLLTSQLTTQARTQPYISLLGNRIPILGMPPAAIVIAYFLLPHTSIIAHSYACVMGWAWGAGYIKFLKPPEKALRWVENKGKLVQRIPYYVSVDQKTYGRYGVLPTSNGVEMNPRRSFQV